MTDENVNGVEADVDLTQAGHKRLRTSAACKTCRRKRIKCDALSPACSTCVRSRSTCSYDGTRGNAGESNQSSRGRAHEGADSIEREPSEDLSSHVRSSLSVEPPTGSALLPYIDSFLQNVHPVNCNNFLHPGVLGEALEKAPQVLILALCGVTAKFTSFSGRHEQGRIWIEQAARKVMALGSISTLNIAVLQLLATHEMQDGNFMAAWNYIGMAKSQRC